MLPRVTHEAVLERAELRSQFHHRPVARKQRGAYTAAFAVMVIFLLGFVGLALDSGRLFVAKTELQNAADACALAAAGTFSTLVNNDQIALASATGVTMATSHKYQMQGAAIPAGNVTVGYSYNQTGPFDVAGSFTPSTTNTSPPYVKCTVSDPAINPIFVKVWNLFQANSVGQSSARAVAVATLIPGGSACGLPIAICANSTLNPPSGGNATWLRMVNEPGTGAQGWYNWVNFFNGTTKLCDVNGSTPCTRTFVSGPGMCQSSYATHVGSNNGVISNLQSYFNTRFGLYKSSPASNYDPDIEKPDYSGVIFNAATFIGKDVYPAYKQMLSGGTAGVQVVTSTTYDPTKDHCKATTLGAATPADCKTLFGNQTVDPSYLQIKKDTSKYDRKETAGSRRMVIMPVVACDGTGRLNPDPGPILWWACGLVTTPFITADNTLLGNWAKKTSGSYNYSFFPYVEYRGRADSPSAGCINLTGSPSSSSLTRIPGLVQ